MASATLIRPKTYLAHGQIFQQGKPVPVTAEVAEALRGTGRFYIDEETLQPTRKGVVIKKTRADKAEPVQVEPADDPPVAPPAAPVAAEPDEGVSFG